MWENTCDQVTVGDHCSAETRVAHHEKHNHVNQSEFKEDTGSRQQAPEKNASDQLTTGGHWFGVTSV